ncbi:MAG: DUF5123 domain-containing protein [Bacteroidales bacterium]
MKPFSYKSIIPAVALCFASAFSFTACTETNDWGVDSEYDRLFRPANFAAKNVQANTADLSWSKIPGTDHYVLEISKDSLEFASIIDTFHTVNAEYILEELEGATGYSVRIKGISYDETKEDSRYSALYFQTKSEQIMQAVTSSDRTATTVTLRWTAGATVTHITLTDSEGVEVLTSEVSAEELQLGEKTIEELSPETTYLAAIYNGENRRGYTSFRTFPAAPPADNTIYMAESDSLNQPFFDALSGKVTIVLPANSHYITDTYNLVLPDGVSVTFYGVPGGDKPVLELRLIKLGLGHEYVKFQNVELRATAAAPQYLINQADACSVETVEFDDCYVSGYVNTMFRFQGSATKTVENFRINNMIANAASGSSYSFIHISADATSYLNNIEITNSTFTNLGYSLLLHNKSNNNSIKVSDCTMHNVVGSGRYFIDMSGSFNSTNGIRLENLILGGSGNDAARGVRPTPVVDNVYQTESWVTASNAIPSTIKYPGAADALFVDPNNGDFTIKDIYFEGVNMAGDPRWRVSSRRR